MLYRDLQQYKTADEMKSLIDNYDYHIYHITDNLNIYLERRNSLLTIDTNNTNFIKLF